jgi:hypothetical protein
MSSKDSIVPKCKDQHDPHMAETFVEWARSSRDNSVHIENRRDYAVESGANLTREIDFSSLKSEFPSSSGKPGRKSMTRLDKSTPSSSPLQFRVASSAEYIKSNAQLQYRRNDSKFVMHPAALDLPHH